MKSLVLILCVLSLLFACKQKTKIAPPRLKKVVKIYPIQTKYIELEDGSQYGMGENLYNRLISILKENDHFVVVVSEQKINSIKSRAVTANTLQKNNDRLHFDFPPYVISELNAEIVGLNFTHGSKGNRKFYGFSSDFTTPWNEGNLNFTNEFKQYSISEINSFGNTFDPINIDGHSSLAGINAGSEGELDLVFANIHYKRDRFNAMSEVKSQMNFLDNKLPEAIIHTNGSGFLFAFGINVFGTGGEFTIAKRTALKKVFDQSVNSIAEEIQNKLIEMPFITKIESTSSSEIIVNAGRREGLIVGDMLFSQEKNDTYQVKEVFEIGSVVECISKNCTPSPGLLLSASSNSAPPKIEPNKQINFTPNDFLGNTSLENQALSWKAEVVLPFEQYQWQKFDQAPHLNPTPERVSNIINHADKIQYLNWSNISNFWESCRCKPGENIIVAILDTGIDYNHKQLSGNFSNEYLGFDYTSYDTRPFDDNSHGTAIAGIIAGHGNQILGYAPFTRLLSYKVIDPFGQTSSAGIFAATKNALERGAKIIVFPWDSAIQSKALEAAITLIESKEALAVVASGDQGNQLLERPRYPAGIVSSNKIAVAALNINGNILEKYGRYSNFSPEIIDIAAFAEDLNVAAPNDSITKRSGSDLAAAQVAGALAVFWSIEPHTSAMEIKRKFLNSMPSHHELNAYVQNGRYLKFQN